MDFLKNAASSLGSSNGNSNNNQSNDNNNNNNNQQQHQQQGQNQQGQNQQGQNQQSGSSDYGDKAFDFISKKAGHDFTPDQDEKITDGLRGAYEKYSGSKVDGKYSN